MTQSKRNLEGGLLPREDNRAPRDLQRCSLVPELRALASLSETSVRVAGDRAQGRHSCQRVGGNPEREGATWGLTPPTLQIKYAQILSHRPQVTP